MPKNDTPRKFEAKASAEEQRWIQANAKYEAERAIDACGRRTK